MALDGPAADRAPSPRAGAAARRRQGRERLGNGRRVRAQASEERAEHARAGLGIGQRAVAHLDLDAERVGERGEPALAYERREATGEGDRTQRRWIGPLQAGAVKRLAQHTAIEGGVVGDEHPAL